MRISLKFLVLALAIWWPTAGSAQKLTAKDYFLLGAAKYKCNACKHSVDDFSKAIQMDGKYAEAWYGRGLAYICLGELKEALSNINRAISLAPDQVLYREAKGRVKSRQGDSKGAIKEFRDAVAMDSLCWQAWYGLAVEEHATGNLYDAEDHFNRSLDLKPDFTMGYIDRARLYIDLQRYPKALANLGTAEGQEPEYAPIYMHQAEALYFLGYHEDAIQKAGKALSLDPELTQAYFIRGEAHLARESYRKAEADYGEAVSRDKLFAEAWYKRGRSLDLLGDLKGARKYYNQAIKRNPTVAVYYVDRAEVLVKMEKPKNAVADLGKALTLDKNNIDLHLKRAFLYLEMENYSSSVPDFAVVNKEDPENGPAWYGMGVAKYQEGNVRTACGCWKRALTVGEARAADELAKYCNE